MRRWPPGPGFNCANAASWFAFLGIGIPLLASDANAGEKDSLGNNEVIVQGLEEQTTGGIFGRGPNPVVERSM